ncbi:MAG: hypothetical protein HS111_18995 [Kofleriaceae bacterium]|nr:hypothetical protein [Kofleriaceae bacterium]
MARLLLGSLLSLSLLGLGCAPAYADRIASPRPLVPIAVAPDAVRSPYGVEIMASDGDSLDTFFHKGRYYVHGASGQRYTIRVTNPTSQRIEAVVSVDGLDVIDGESGDLRKRGYVVPAHGQVLIEGWRTSLSDVASFRFSSVGGSYAGKKGKARNVGVIAVAIFAEQAAPQIIVDEPRYRGGDDGYYGDEVEGYLDRRAPAGPGATRPADRAGGRSGGGGADKSPPSGQRPADHGRRRRRGRGALRPRRAACAARGQRPGPRRALLHRGPAPRRSASAPSSASSATQPPPTPASCAAVTARSRSPSSATTTPPASRPLGILVAPRPAPTSS